MKFFVTLLTIFLCSATSIGAASETKGFDKSHGKFAQLLQRFVKEGQHASSVDYKSLKKNHVLLDSYLDEISGVGKKEFDSWDKNDQLAFLINAYNAFTLKLIIDNYPVQSIKDIGSLFSSAWKQEFFTLFGSKTHLDQIEHGLIRKNYKEARIHFAVNCASIGCPKLSSKPFTGSALDGQLEKSAKDFLTDHSRNRYDPKDKELKVSKIFDWYGEDFGTEKELKTYIIKTMGIAPEPLPAQVKLEFLDYDWKLNETK